VPFLPANVVKTTRGKGRRSAWTQAARPAGEQGPRECENARKSAALRAKKLARGSRKPSLPLLLAML